LIIPGVIQSFVKLSLGRSVQWHLLLVCLVCYDSPVHIALNTE